MIRRLLIWCVLLLPIATQAHAAARDEMLSGIARCNSITDNRTFLDCAYGAAQPLRAELGLPPAPPSQIALVPPRIAGAPAPAMQAAAPPPPAPKRSTGFFGSLLGTGATETPPTPMASYGFNSEGMFTVTLKDGQVWRQNPDDDHVAHWKKPAASYIVTVTSGALGSSNMQVQGESVSYKVKRLH